MTPQGWCPIINPCLTAGNPVNVLSVILVISFLVPLAGLAFAYWSYGVLWG